MPRQYRRNMSYTLTIGCGCQIYVACHPRTNVAHTRIIERRGDQCRVRAHDLGVRLALWEMLAEPAPARDRPHSDPAYGVSGFIRTVRFE
jgi:hypothetical protein